MTKQHIWPNWMNRTFPKKGNVRPQITGTISNIYHSKGRTVFVQEPTYKEKNGHLGKSSLRIVCQKCNGGWMSKLENDTKENIIDLVTHQPFVLNQERQTTLAAWVALMTIMAEFTDIPTKVISYEERKLLMESVVSPKTLSIWIGKCSSVDWTELSYWHRGMTLLNTSTSDLSTKLKPNAIQSSYFTIGGLFIYVVSTNRPEIQPLVDSYEYPGLSKIWPLTNNEIVWSDQDIISNDNKDVLPNDLLTSFYKNIGIGIRKDGGVDILSFPTADNSSLSN